MRQQLFLPVHLADDLAARIDQVRGGDPINHIVDDSLGVPGLSRVDVAPRGTLLAFDVPDRLLLVLRIINVDAQNLEAELVVLLI